MAKFNNFKAFTGGVAQAFNNANARQDQERMELDMAKQKEMLSYDHERAILQAKQDQEQSLQQSNLSAAAAYNKSNSTKATTNALDAAQQSQAPVSDVTTPVSPQAQAQPASGMPAGGSMPNITVNGQSPQATTAPTPTQGGLQSQQPSQLPPISGAVQDNVTPTPSAVATPQDLAPLTQKDSGQWEGSKEREDAIAAQMGTHLHQTIQGAAAAADRQHQEDVQKQQLNELTMQEKRAVISDKEPSIIYKDNKVLKNEADKAGLPYDRDPMLAEMSKSELIKNKQEDSKVLEKLAEPVVQNANDILTRLNNIVGLNKYVETGGKYAIPGATELRTTWDQNAAEMQKDIAYVTLRNRPTSGYGRVTNADLNMFKQASPSLAIPNEANYVVAAAMMQQQMDQKEYWRFRQNWTSRYGGDNPAKIDSLWDAYKDSNPIFDPNSTPDSPKFNTNRQTSAEFFRGKSADDILATRPATASVPSSVAPSPEKSASETTKDNDFSHLWK